MLEGLSVWTLLSVAEIVWVPVAAVFMIMQRRSPQATLAWIFALVFLPVVGIMVYFFVGPRRFERQRQLRADAASIVEGMHEPEVTSWRADSEQAAALMKLSQMAVGAIAMPRRAELKIFFDGASAYAAIEAAIAEARHHVHCEYYIWEPDRIGTQLRDLLRRKAEDGVKVRVLVDDFGSSKAREKFWAPLIAAGAEVMRFNALTFKRWRPRMTNFRTHRKIVVVDGQIGFTGGMNVTDVHTASHTGDEAWRDTHVKMTGPAVKGLQLVFFEDWYCCGMVEVPDAAAYLQAGEVASERRVQVVSSGPEEHIDAIHKLYFSAITGARERVLLTTPYFVPDETLVNALNTAALRGVDVRILVPARGDLPLVAAAASTFYDELLATGVRVYEYGPVVLHAKTLVVDDHLAIVGTANVDNRSFKLNFEIVLASYATEDCDRLSQQFETDLESAHEVTSAALAQQPLPRRIAAAGARLFAPLL